MTPLIVIPARQMSEGRPCKNREAWPALCEVLRALPSWPTVVVTDDPWVAQAIPDPAFLYWLSMGPDHTVAAAVQYALARWVPNEDHPLVVVLQPSSPTRNRPSYVRTAVHHLQHEPDSSVISVVPWAGEPPSKACYLTESGHLQVPSALEPRQRQPRAYRRDGTVYAVRMSYAQTGDLYGPRPVPLLIAPGDSVTLD